MDPVDRWCRIVEFLAKSGDWARDESENYHNVLAHKTRIDGLGGPIRITIPPISLATFNKVSELEDSLLQLGVVVPD